MDSIENTFSDNEGNHLMVALDFCDNDYKQDSLNIPTEYSDVEIVDISIEKVYLEKPINPIVFFQMSSWLLEQFEIHDNAVFTFICSTDELPTGTRNYKTPQIWRWTLFDRLFNRIKTKTDLNSMDVIVGPEEYLTYGRAFYRSKHAPIIHIISAHLKEKQNQYHQ